MFLSARKRPGAAPRKRRRAPGLARNTPVLFEHPRLYDLAFGFRNVAEQCDGLVALAERYGDRAPRSAVELCCGQANHLRELARRGLRTYGIDSNRDMLAYARSLDAPALKSAGLLRGGAGLLRGGAGLQCADIRTFTLPERVDLAYCLFDSFCHCTTDADAIATLRSTGKALRRGGVFIVELTHPADFFAGIRSRSLSRWTQRYPDVVISTRFAHTRIDPVNETFVPSITIDARYTDGRPPARIVDEFAYRMWMPSALRHVAAASGCFDIVGWHGDLTPVVPFDMTEDSWQMVVVMRRR